MLLLVAWFQACGTEDGGGPQEGSALCNVDADGDGFGSSTAVPATSCTDEGVADNADDCDDEAASIHPGATETAADDIDQDCDGNDLCYEDLDGDGYGGVSRLESDCAAAGLVGRDGDCNEGDAAVHPGAEEIPVDAIDQDCDGFELCYVDSDGDAFGISIPVESVDRDCSDGGEADNPNDCLDVGADGPATFPGSAENEADWASMTDACMTDADGDGYGSSSPAKGVTPGRDCDDADPKVSCREFHVGNDAEFADSSRELPNYLLGTRLEVKTPMTVTDLALIGKDSGANVRMALYTDDGGPDALVVEAPSAPMVVGVLEMPVDPTPIEAGDYWIMAIYDVTLSLGIEYVWSGEVCQYRLLPFAHSMPDPFGPITTGGEVLLNYYIVGY
jgi:hypothetical protein